MALSRYSTTPFAFGFNDYFGPLTPFDTDPEMDPWMPVLGDEIKRDASAMIRHSSPGYEIHENDDTYQIAMQVPGVNAQDIDAQLEDSGRTLHVRGSKVIATGTSTSSTRFDKRFTVGDNVDTTNLEADLTNGVLTVTAPKTKKRQITPMKLDISEGHHKRLEA